MRSHGFSFSLNWKTCSQPNSCAVCHRHRERIRQTSNRHTLFWHRQKRIANSSITYPHELQVLSLPLQPVLGIHTSHMGWPWSLPRRAIIASIQTCLHSMSSPRNHRGIYPLRITTFNRQRGRGSTRRVGGNENVTQSRFSFCRRSTS